MTPLLAQRPRVDRSFERLYQRHVADVYRYSLALLRNPADAEDVTQTTFLNAYRAFQRGEHPHAPQNWLIAIAHNVCRQRFRQSTRRPQEVAFDDDVADTIVDDEAPSAADIRQALGHLAFNQRAALVMRELEGRTYAEIGDILDLSVSAVETLIFRARRALREQLEGSLSCGEAERAISKQVDGRLPRSEKGALRAHLRQCPECAKFARSQRAQRAAFKALGAAPIPTSLSSFFGGGGGAAVGTAVAAKAAAVLAAGALVGGVGYEGAKQVRLIHGGSSSARSAPAKVSPGAPGAAAVPMQRVVVASASGTRSAAKTSKAAAPKRTSAGKSRAKGGSAATPAKAAKSQPSARNSRSGSRGTPTRTRAWGSPARGNSSAKGRRAGGGSPATPSGTRRKTGAHGSSKAAADPVLKPPVPPGQVDKTPKSKPSPPAVTVPEPPPVPPVETSPKKTK
jgi:RNA polymerase sigma factor (sigma-70 family)